MDKEDVKWDDTGLLKSTNGIVTQTADVIGSDICNAEHDKESFAKANDLDVVAGG